MSTQASTLTATAEPLYERIRQALRTEILDGRYAPGSRVPSESSLSATHGASRITVRQALAALQQEGLIYTLQGKGSFVAQPKAFQNVSTLQGFGEHMASLGHEVLNHIHSLGEVAASAQVAAKLNLTPGEPVTQIVRVRLLNREPVSIEWTWVPVRIGRQLAQADLITRDIFLMLENDCAVPLGHADLAADAVPADSEIAHALRIEPGQPVLRIERLTHDRDGVPVDYEFLYFRGDTFQYRFRIDRHRPQE